MNTLLLLVAFVSAVCLTQCYADSLSRFRTNALTSFNKIRTDNGLSTAHMDNDLNDACQTWVNKLVSSQRFYIKNTHVNGNFAWELIYQTYGDEQEGDKVLKSWMDDSSTKRTMVKPGFTKFGIGKAAGYVGRSRVYKYVAMFQK